MLPEFALFLVCLLEEFGIVRFVNIWEPSETF